MIIKYNKIFNYDIVMKGAILHHFPNYLFENTCTYQSTFLFPGLY